MDDLNSLPVKRKEIGVPITDLSLAMKSARTTYCDIFRLRTPSTDNLMMAASALARLFMALFVACAIVPVKPLLPTHGLDPSWMQALNHATARQLAFGSDVIFSFGPYASLFTRVYHPLTDSLMLGAGALLAACSIVLGLNALRQSHPLLVLLWAALFALLAIDRNALMMAPAMLHTLALLRTDPADSRTLSFITFTGVIASGLIVLVKSSMIPYCIAILLFTSIWLYIQARKSLAFISLLGFLAAVAAFWLLAGQRMGSLPPFLFSSIDIISGYTDSMSVPGPTPHLAVYLIGSAFIVASTGFALRKDHWRAMLALGCVGVFLFVSFKAAFVRHDGIMVNHDDTMVFHGHAATAAFSLLAGMLFAITLTPPRQLLLPLLISTTLGYCAIFGSYGPLSLKAHGTHVLAVAFQAIDGLLRRARHPEAYRQAYDVRMEQLRKALPLEHSQDSSDIYAYNQSVLFANDMSWNPRPVFQSYSAYTPSLLEYNRRHLIGNGRPQTLFFNVETIDNRYPSLDDGTSWETLRLNYELASGGDQGLQTLRRLPGAVRIAHLVKTGHYRIPLGESLKLPMTKDLLYARVRYEKTVSGQLMSIAYKPAELEVLVDLADGQQRTYRMIPGQARAGFLLSPLVDSSREFRWVMQGDHESLTHRRVTAVTFLRPKRTFSGWADSVMVEIAVPR